MLMGKGSLQEEEVRWSYYDFKRHTPLVPVVFSILAIIAWFIFILLYALFWSNDFSLFQNVIVTVVSSLVTGLVLGLMRAVWRFRFARRHVPSAPGA